jgi:Ras-related protein Rab-6A
VRNLNYQNKNYRLQLWDTAGQERFKSLIPSYLKDSHLCILVYDISDPKSLENLPKWH